MSDKAQELAARVVRNVNGVELKHFVRGNVYESHGGRLSEGTAAKKLAVELAGSASSQPRQQAAVRRCGLCQPRSSSWRLRVLTLSATRSHS